MVDEKWSPCINPWTLCTYGDFSCDGYSAAKRHFDFIAYVYPALGRQSLYGFDGALAPFMESREVNKLFDSWRPLVGELK